MTHAGASLVESTQAICVGSEPVSIRHNGRLPLLPSPRRNLARGGLVTRGLIRQRSPGPGVKTEPTQYEEGIKKVLGCSDSFQTESGGSRSGWVASGRDPLGFPLGDTTEKARSRYGGDTEQARDHTEQAWLSLGHAGGKWLRPAGYRVGGPRATD